MNWDGIERRAAQTTPGTPCRSDPFGQIPDPPGFVPPARVVWDVEERAEARLELWLGGMGDQIKPGLAAALTALIEAP